MQSPEGQTGTHREEAKVEDTQIVEGKAVATAAALILNKDEGRHPLSLAVGWVEQVARGVEVAVAMELADQILNRLALMVHLVQAECQTTIISKVVLAPISSMETGNRTVDHLSEPSQYLRLCFWESIDKFKIQMYMAI